MDPIQRRSISIPEAVASEMVVGGVSAAPNAARRALSNTIFMRLVQYFEKGPRVAIATNHLVRRSPGNRCKQQDPQQI